MTQRLGMIETSAVKEMANIGLGHATTSLSDLTGRPFNMDIPVVSTVDVASAGGLSIPDDEVAVAICVPFEGDVEGATAFIFPWGSACHLWTLLLGSPPESSEAVDELHQSAALEVGNILCSSFLRALSDMTGLSLAALPPMVSVETFSTLTSTMIAQAEFERLTALAIETRLFDQESPEIGGVFLCLPSETGLGVILNQLGIVEAA